MENDGKQRHKWEYGSEYNRYREEDHQASRGRLRLKNGYLVVYFCCKQLTSHAIFII